MGSRHFDSHAFHSEALEGVKDCPRGCLRSYLILKEKAEQFAGDPNLQGLLAQIRANDGSPDGFIGTSTPEKAAALNTHRFDRQALAAWGMQV